MSHQNPKRVYLDNAATTWPKSAAAVEAAIGYIRECGATAGRGAYASAQVAESWLARARTQVAQLVGAQEASQVAFCSSGTHALNAALGLLRDGDHVVTSQIEHNSLLRPLSQLQSEGRVTFEVVEGPSANLRKSPNLVAIGHASNVTGLLTDLSSWRRLADDAQCPLLVDASQTLGYVPIDMGASGIDLLAAAGHKGLLGIQGTGLLVADEVHQSRIRPILTGGTGSQSESLEPARTWPLVVEVGNLNLPGIVSMAVAAEELNALHDLRTGWEPSFLRLRNGLHSLPQIKLLGQAKSMDEPATPTVPVLSMRVEGWDIHNLAAILDTTFGIEVRAGFHCAALIHQSLQSDDSGTLRMSTGRHTTLDEVDYALEALRQILLA